jgi:hypothetical protein
MLVDSLQFLQVTTQLGLKTSLSGLRMRKREMQLDQYIVKLKMSRGNCEKG